MALRLACRHAVLGDSGSPKRLLWRLGRDLGPAVPAAGKALENGSIGQVEKLLTDAIRNGVHKHFDAALGHRK